ncbi:MAG: 5'/3'-nucleotidase SurE [Sedimentisphaerales bacterium]|nr:5'/3'-nucleotidase SurE [Sedimentisphaerales bacterium]
MKILLTNDDGIFAPGLSAIYKELANIGEVIVVAPSDSKSGASHSVTFSRPMLCNKVNINDLFTGYSLQGSPADCVKLAVMELHKEPLDLVVSGINNGANAGINVYYSGTVAAAMEGAFLRIPSVALSLSYEEPMDFEKAARYFIRILQNLLPLKKGEVVNINIPQLSKGEPKGIRVVPQSSTGFAEEFVSEKNELGQTIFLLTGKSHRDDNCPSDINSLEEGFITVTALTPDMTHKRNTERLKEKLGDFTIS